METEIDSYSQLNRNGANQVYGNENIGQSFTNTNQIVLNKVVLYLEKLGSPTGSAVINIYAHAGTYGTSSVPTGSSLAVSDNFDASTLSSSVYNLIDFTFSGANKITLSANTKYCFAITFPTGDSSNKILVGNDTTTPTHDGNMAYKSGGAWVAFADTDLCFYVYGDNAELPSTLLSVQDALNTKAGTTGLSIQQAINSLAGTTGLTSQDAWNTYAGTTGLSCQQCANVKVGMTDLTYQQACNLL